MNVYIHIFLLLLLQEQYTLESFSIKGCVESQSLEGTCFHRLECILCLCVGMCLMHSVLIMLFLVSVGKAWRMHLEHVAKESKLVKSSSMERVTMAARLVQATIERSYLPLSNISSTLHMLLQLIYKKLPADISSRHVLLLDPVLASGLMRKKISIYILYHAMY